VSEQTTARAAPERGPRGYRAALAALLAGQAALALWVAGRSFFFADDFVYGHLLTTEPMSLGLLLRSCFGHLVPGFIALDWTFNRTVGMNWAAATAVIVAAQLGTTVALVRLLSALRGRSWGNLLAAALVAFSLAFTAQSLWWGAVVTNLVPLAATVATLGCFARWVTRGHQRHLVAMAVMFGIAVAFYEKSVLTAAYVGLLSLLVLDAGLPWRRRWATTLRRWPAWLILGVIAGADLAVYATGPYLAEAGAAPSPRSLLGFLLLSFPEGLVPSLFGFLPRELSGGSGTAVLVVTNAVVLALVVWSSLRSRRALQAWIFFALCYLLNQGVLGRGRVGLMGVHMGTQLRYQMENVVFFAIALAVTLPLVAALGRRLVPAGPRRRWAAGAVALVGLPLFLVPWSQGLRAETAASPGVATRPYMDTLRASYDAQASRTPDLAFVAGDVVPDWVVHSGMAPFNRFDLILPQVLPAARFDETADRVLAVAQDGTVHEALFAATTPVELSGACLTEGAPAIEALPVGPLPWQNTWASRLRYDATGAGALQVTVVATGPAGNTTTTETFAVDDGGHQLLAAIGGLPVVSVSLALAGPGQLCVDSLEIGTFQPV
jgi:hypothetical protein